MINKYGFGEKRVVLKGSDLKICDVHVCVFLGEGIANEVHIHS